MKPKDTNGFQNNLICEKFYQNIVPSKDYNLHEGK